jgi:HAD superfamily hydrolase (TIGR01509 family)
MKPFNAVIFDMDGLMLDTESVSIEAWRLARAAVGYFVSDKIILSMIGRNMTDITTRLHRQLSEDAPVEELLSCADQHYHRLLDESPPPVKPGLLAVLDKLEAQGIPKGIATSSTELNAEQKLGSTGLRGRFSQLVCGNQIARGKPEPDIFIEAARRLDLPCTACLVLEDSNPGIEAAWRAGSPVIMVPDYVPPTDESQARAEAILDSLDDFLPLIA